MTNDLTGPVHFYAGIPRLKLPEAWYNFTPVFTGVSCIGIMGQMPQRYLPTPVARWVSRSANWRDRWLGELAKDHEVTAEEVFAIQPHDMLDETLSGRRWSEAFGDALEGISATSEGVIGAFRVLDNLRQPVATATLDLTLDAKAVFEAAAHIVQLQSSWINLGEPETKKLEAFVMAPGNATLKPLQALSSVVSQIEGTSVDRLHALLCWCMLGSPDQRWRFGNPDLRMLALIQHLTQNPGILRRAPLEAGELWSHLDANLGQPPWRENLADGDRAFMRRLTKLETEIGAFDDKLSRSILLVARFIADQQKVAKQRVLDDPSSYALPGRYLSVSESWPMPAVEIANLAGREYEIDYVRPDLPDIEIIHLGGNRRVVLGEIKYPAGLPDDLRAALSMYRRLNHWIDYIFLDGDDSKLSGLLAKLSFESEMGKTCLNVF